MDGLQPGKDLLRDLCAHSAHAAGKELRRQRIWLQLNLPRHCPLHTLQAALSAACKKEGAAVLLRLLLTFIRAGMSV